MVAFAIINIDCNKFLSGRWFTKIFTELYFFSKKIINKVLAVQ